MRSLRNDSDVGVSSRARKVQAAGKYSALENQVFTNPRFRSKVWICEDLVLQTIKVQYE
jgi:hypothetical protein